MSDGAFRVWIYMLPHTDYKGRYRGDVRWIKSQCLANLEIEDETVETYLQELDNKKLTHFYYVGEKRFLVYHDHEQWNPSKGLKFQRTKWPDPPSELCKCLGGPAAVPNAVPNGVGNAASPVPLPSLSRLSPVTSQDGVIGKLIQLALSQGIMQFGQNQIRVKMESLIMQGFTEAQIETLLVANRGRDILKIDFGVQPPLERQSVAEQTFTEAKYVEYLKRLHKDDGMMVKPTSRGVYMNDGHGNWRRDDAASRRQYEDKVAHWNSQPDDVKWDLIRAEKMTKLPPEYIPPAGWRNGDEP